MQVKVGTIELDETAEKKNRPTKTTLEKGSGGSGRNNDGGGGGDNNNGDNNHNNPEEIEEFQPNKYRVGMWIILMMVVMTFSSLVGAYILLAMNPQREWQPFTLPLQVWFSTAIIISSSVTFGIANYFLEKEKQAAAKQWFIATTVLGAMFIASQIMVWSDLVNRGIYLASDPYAGFFYFLTALHALHIIGGICGLGYIVLRTWNPTKSIDSLFRRKTASNVVGMYWHFMDGLWILLILMLGFFR